ncbi:hypothetical protein ACFLV3_05370 [Chloroflexota bacterium]
MSPYFFCVEPANFDFQLTDNLFNEAGLAGSRFAGEQIDLQILSIMPMLNSGYPFALFIVSNITQIGFYCHYR